MIKLYKVVILLFLAGEAMAAPTLFDSLQVGSVSVTGANNNFVIGGQLTASNSISVLAGTSTFPAATITSLTVSSLTSTNFYNTQLGFLSSGFTNLTTSSSLTANRTFTLPDANSNPVQPSTAAAHQFATGISSAGVITWTQPAFSDISGTATSAQLPADVVYTDVSQTIISNKVFNLRTGFPNGIAITNANLTGASGVITIDSANGLLLLPTNVEIPTGIYDSSGFGAFLVSTRIINDLTPTASIDANSRLLYDSTPVQALNYNTRLLKDSSSSNSLDWANGYLLDTTGGQVVKWRARTTLGTWTNQVALVTSNFTALGTLTLPANSIGYSALPTGTSTNITTTLAGTAITQSPNGTYSLSASGPAFTYLPNSQTFTGTNGFTSPLLIINGNSNQVVSASLTGLRTFTLPDANSNPVQPSTAGAHQFATGISSAGVITWTQPAFSDISGSATVAQGGTSTNNLTLNGVLYGNGTSPVLQTAQGAANTVLIANAGAPSFSSSPTLASLTLTSSLNAPTNTASYGTQTFTASPTINSVQTNSNSRLNVDVSVVLTPAAAGVASAGIWGSSGTSNIISIVSVPAGVSETTKTMAMHRLINPGEIYVLTNLSTSTATAVLTNLLQQSF